MLLARRWYNRLPQKQNFQKEWGVPADHIADDMVWTALLVYELANPDIFVEGFPNNKDYSLAGGKVGPTIDLRAREFMEDPDTVSNKVQTLARYGFISDRERDIALDEIEKFGDDENVPAMKTSEKRDDHYKELKGSVPSYPEVRKECGYSD